MELEALPAAVARPAYAPSGHGPGIVHLGLGAFFKAHLAVYTDDALAGAGGDWRIIGVSLRSKAPSAALAAQNELYTCVERDLDGTMARVIGSLAAALNLPEHRADVLRALTDPATRIISLTVTEKGYGLNRSTGGVDAEDPVMAHDLANPDAPHGVAGLLVWALRARRLAGHAPFTVLSCDNMPNNGAMLRGLLIDFAQRTAPEIAPHIAEDVAFPATMVDRITPASTQETLALAEELTGQRDAAAVTCEGFRQWVIEDNFPQGRPAWDAGGAQFVSDVAPFEDMKLRMLNGAHSMLAYAGFRRGRRFVRDVMADPVLAPRVTQHLEAAAATLRPIAGMDFARYASDLTTRFRNPHLDHETYQIAMDGSQKMPQRIFAPARDAHAAGQDLLPFAYATAAWIAYLRGERRGAAYDLRDPRAAELSLAPEASDDARVEHVFALPNLIPDALRGDAQFRAHVLADLGTLP